MFMFPEPPPLDYYLTDVSPTLKSDGIFYHGKPSMSHKCVAKHLKPIKRTILDPLAPIQEVNPRVLQEWVNKDKMYVDHPTKDDGLVFRTLCFLPKSELIYHRKQKPLFSVFPRSVQYELWYIREKQMKELEKQKAPIIPCNTQKEETVKKDEEPCNLLKVPFWWKDKTEKPSGIPPPVGNINDYAYEKFDKNLLQDVKISEKLEIDHPSKYIPGAIHRLQGSGDTSMIDTLHQADTFKVVLKEPETLAESPPVEEDVCYSEKHHIPVVSDYDEDNDKDIRWYPIHEDLELPKTEPERQEELRKLTKPFLHDLHTWYSKNKPTKLFTPVRQIGKKAMPERRFSHL
ncbi:uncharacterized protein LOC108001612 [Apis cerana]|uniref:uncharacterized protein LOC108001612 n=1 Tax=Apis cerana TaxID=7461 RepID=UPI002B237D43|nr:uncharacterized protein LOC108001612 [Apis cerana]